MALTDAQKASCRTYLGYSDIGQGGSATPLDNRLDSVSVSAEAQVTTILARLVTIEADLVLAWDRQKVLKAEEVTLAGEGEIRALKNEGRRFCRQLAIIFGVEPRSDAFGAGMATSGPLGRG